MSGDPVICQIEHGGKLSFVRASSGHAVHHADVEREGFCCGPESARLIIGVLRRSKVRMSAPVYEEVMP